jgi:hypothetical protein
MPPGLRATRSAPRFNTEFIDPTGNVVVPTIIPGSIIVVPEPSSLVLAGFGAIVLAAVIRRRRR